MKKTISMRLMKEHKTLAEYAEVSTEVGKEGERVLKPYVSPVYLRKSELGAALPVGIEITVTLIP